MTDPAIGLIGLGLKGSALADRLVVKPGDSLKLRYDVLLFDTPASAPIDFASAYRRFQPESSRPR